MKHSKNKIFLLILFFTIGITVISNKKSKLELVGSNSPIELKGIDVSFYNDISYGDRDNNKFDIFLPNSKSKTPLVIFIHGGGFVGGDKSKAYKNEYPKQIRTLLKNNIAYAAINYSFITDSESKGVITSLSDSKKCLQFIRYYSEELNIDKERIAVYGSSAGAGTSLWLGLHDDMKNRASNNPIDRESTRIKVVGALETQATYDLVKWGTNVFKPFNLSINKLAESGMKETILTFYGIKNLDQLYSDKTKNYRKDIDFLTLMSNDDPPIFIKNSKYGAGVPKSKKELNHHPFHAKALKEQADKIGLKSIFNIPKLDINNSAGLNLVEFIIQNLNK